MFLAPTTRDKTNLHCYIDKKTGKYSSAARVGRSTDIISTRENVGGAPSSFMCSNIAEKTI